MPKFGVVAPLALTAVTVVPNAMPACGVAGDVAMVNFAGAVVKLVEPVMLFEGYAAVSDTWPESAYCSAVVATPELLNASDTSRPVASHAAAALLPPLRAIPPTRAG